MSIAYKEIQEEGDLGMEETKYSKYWH
jgi:hypothetical protein